MGRRALIIGIDEYDHISNLPSCVKDAQRVNNVLERHAHNNDNEKNFHTELITSNTHKTNRSYLINKIRDLFQDARKVSLLYFSGHGHQDSTGGYLLTTECAQGNEGLSMNDIFTLANQSPAGNKIVILDCCHAGKFGKDPLNTNITRIGEGVTILVASAANQYAGATTNSSIFTDLLIHALEGGAASILGDVTPANVYGYIDKAIGELGQRPLFMTNVRRYVTLRKVWTQLNLNELKQITSLFDKGPDKRIPLDSSFESTSSNPNPENVHKFGVLQKLNRMNLVIPVNALHMYDAAMNNESCELTSLGKSYWVMVNNNVI